MIEINNSTNFKLDKKSFSQLAKKVLKGENRERENISIAFVSSAEIKKLNQKYRKKNKPTDVLSFKLDEKDCLGEIVICPEVVKKEEEKIERMLIHGILHILGYEHEKSKKEAEMMRVKEEHYLYQFF